MPPTVDRSFLLVRNTALHNGIIAILAALFKDYNAMHKRWAEQIGGERSEECRR
jgi:hypothetical protein